MKHKTTYRYKAAVNDVYTLINVISDIQIYPERKTEQQKINNLKLWTDVYKGLMDDTSKKFRNEYMYMVDYAGEKLKILKKICSNFGFECKSCFTVYHMEEIICKNDSCL